MWQFTDFMSLKKSYKTYLNKVCGVYVLIKLIFLSDSEKWLVTHQKQRTSANVSDTCEVKGENFVFMNAFRHCF